MKKLRFLTFVIIPAVFPQFICFRFIQNYVLTVESYVEANSIIGCTSRLLCL
jgi:hypothetical protein